MGNIVWLSGSRGFIGPYLKQALIHSGYTVTCLSNSFSKGDDIIYTDFSNREKIRKAIKLYGAPDSFIHLGWGDVYKPHNETHTSVNLQDGINLIDELYECGLKRFLLIGSSSEYGSLKGELYENLKSLDSGNNYIRGKATLAKYGLDIAKKLNRIFIHVRLFYTYGAGQKHNSLINQLFQCYLKNDAIKLSPCENYRDYIYVSEAAEGISKITAVNQSEIINLGSGKVIQLKKFIRLFWDELGANADKLLFGAHEIPVSEQSQPRSFANLNKLKNLTHWSPSMSIEDGIKKTVECLRLSI